MTCRRYHVVQRGVGATPSQSGIGQTRNVVGTIREMYVESDSLHPFQEVDVRAARWLVSSIKR